MRLVVGLGNPGPEYVGSRHNVGFAVADELARRYCGAWHWPSREVSVASIEIAGERVTLVKPQLFMNLSGEALGALDPRVCTAALLVVHDELDLPCGHIRVKRGGGTAGHRGLHSIVAHFGADFSRVRIGVGRPPFNVDAATFVLSTLEPTARLAIESGVQRAADAVACIVQEGERIAMNVFNRRSDQRAAATPQLGRE